MGYIYAWDNVDWFYKGSIISKFIHFFVALDSCMSVYFLHGNFVHERHDNVYNGGYKEFVWKVMLGGRSSNVIIHKIYC